MPCFVSVVVQKPFSGRVASVGADGSPAEALQGSDGSVRASTGGAGCVYDDERADGCLTRSDDVLAVRGTLKSPLYPPVSREGNDSAGERGLAWQRAVFCRLGDDGHSACALSPSAVLSSQRL